MSDYSLIVNTAHNVDGVVSHEYSSLYGSHEVVTNSDTLYISTNHYKSAEWNYAIGGVVRPTSEQCWQCYLR